MDKRFLTGHVKQVDTEQRTLEAYASTGAVDRDNEVILPTAWTNTVEAFKRNPVLMWAHDYRVPPVGKVLDIGVDEHGLKFKAQFAKTQFADEIWGLYRDGFMNTFSVGFIPKAWTDNQAGDGQAQPIPRRIFTDAELLEISAVPIPANPDATVERGVMVLSFKSLEEVGGGPPEQDPDPVEQVKQPAPADPDPEPVTKADGGDIVDDGEPEQEPEVAAVEELDAPPDETEGILGQVAEFIADLKTIVLDR